MTVHIGARSEDQLRKLRDRLAAAYPSVASSVIEEAIAQGLQHTADDRVGLYRLLFVERHARAQLEPCREMHPADGATPYANE